MKDQADRMREELAGVVADAVQTGIARIMHNNADGYGVTESLNLGLNTALCAIIPVVPFLAKRPNLTREEIAKRGGSELVKLLSYENIVFAALITARMHGGSAVESENTERNGVPGTAICQTVNFGPGIVLEALEDWKKLTGKDPEDYFDPRLLAGLHKVTDGARVSVEELLAKIAKSSPSSQTLN